MAGIKTLRAKKGKDCYLVRPMATRTTGLPDARNIKMGRAKAPTQTSDSKPQGDPKTIKLLKDLQLATIAYTRKSLADASIPTQRAIDEARHILTDAQAHVAEFVEDIEEQINDKKLTRLTELMYSRIPRKKKVGAAPETWMLTGNNIQSWQDDLDAFESALRAVEVEVNPNFDIMADMNLQMQLLDPDSDVGRFLNQWCPTATTNRHKKIKDMSILNIWEIDQIDTRGVLEKSQKKLLKGKVSTKLQPAHQPDTRVDVSKPQRSTYKKSNTSLLFHGTRSVNVNAILRESLRLPETLVAVPRTGAKFGPGIYFADDWKKSAELHQYKRRFRSRRRRCQRPQSFSVSGRRCPWNDPPGS